MSAIINLQNNTWEYQQYAGTFWIEKEVKFPYVKIYWNELAEYEWKEIESYLSQSILELYYETIGATKLNDFKVNCEDIIFLLRDAVEQSLPMKGLKSDDCQRTALLLKVNELEHLINGVEFADFVPNESTPKEMLPVN